VEVSIVGDVTADDAIAATARTLGALRTRRDRPEPAGLRDVRFPPPQASPLILRHKGPAGEALVVVNWPTTDVYADMRETEASRVLADVMRMRLFDEIRVKHGWSYSPSVVADFSAALPGYGMITARVTAAPADVPAVLDAIDAIATDLAAHDISADELARAVGPRVEASLRVRQTNGFWLNVLADAQRDPRALAKAISAIGDLNSLKPTDVRAAAQRWLVKARSWRAEVLPAAPTA
jgi:zinc protease